MSEEDDARWWERQRANDRGTGPATSASPAHLAHESNEPLDEGDVAEIEIETIFKRKIAGARLLPRRERAQARREACEWRRFALKAVQLAYRMPDFLTRRNGTWHFVRRVPVEFEKLDTRGIIKHSTRIKIADDRADRRAARVAAKLNEQLEVIWKGLSDGHKREHLTNYLAVLRRAHSLGFKVTGMSIHVGSSQPARA